MTGWIVNCKFFECEPYAHISKIFGTPELECLIPNSEELKIEIDEMYKACQELAEKEGDGNAEWHRYEIVCDDARAEAVAAFYRAGAVRVAPRGMALHCEGVAFDSEFIEKEAKRRGFIKVIYEEATWVSQR